MKPAGHSFFAAFLGWLLPFTGYLAWLQFRDGGRGYITDFNFLLIWPLAFTFLGWLAIGLPIALGLKEKRRQNPGLLVGVYTAATTVTYLLYKAVFGFPSLPFLWWAVMIGVVGGATLWALERYQPGRTWLCWAAPLAFFPLVRFVVLPIGLAFFPYTTYTLTEGVLGQEALYSVIRQVKVGDSYPELHRRYPRVFPEPALSIVSHSGDDTSYSITFDANRERVTRVEISGRGSGATASTQ